MTLGCGPTPRPSGPSASGGWTGDAFTLVAQRAGAYAADHRCPGEPMTEQLMVDTVRLLTQQTRYIVPPQDFSIGLAELPALPRSGIVVRDVRPA